MRLLAQARRAGRVRREPTDRVTLLVAIFVLAGLPVQLLVGVILRGPPEPMSTAPPALWVGAGLLFAVIGFSVLTAIGPVRAGPSEYAWVLSGILDRRSELAPRWARLLVTTGVSGAVIGVTGLGIGGAPASVVVSGAVLGAAAGIAIAAAATGLQGCPTGVRQRTHATVVIGGGLCLAATAVLTALRLLFAIPEIFMPIGAVVASVLAVVATGWSWRTVSALDRAALTEGNALAGATSAAVLFLEPGLVGDLLADRRLSGLRIRRSRSFPAGRVRALLTAETVRTKRNRRAIGLFLCALLVPYAAGLIAPATWLPVVAFLCAVAAVSPLAAGFRRISQSASLRRMIGGSDRTLHIVHLVLPAVAAVLFTLAAAPAMPSNRWLALALTPFGVLSNLWLRSRDRPPVTDNRIADVGFGPVPIDLVWSYLREIIPLLVVVVVQTWI